MTNEFRFGLVYRFVQAVDMCPVKESKHTDRDYDVIFDADTWPTDTEAECYNPKQF